MMLNPQAKMFLSMMKNKNNPQQMVMTMLQQSAGDNPMLQNLIKLAMDGKGATIEEIAKNMLKAQGLDFDKEFGEFMQELNSL